MSIDLNVFNEFITEFFVVAISVSWKVKTACGNSSEGIVTKKHTSGKDKFYLNFLLKIINKIIKINNLYINILYFILSNNSFLRWIFNY